LISERRSDVRWYLRWLIPGLLTAAFCMPALAQGPKTGLKGPKGGLTGGINALEEATCGDHGTSIHFEKSPKDAAKKALKEEKLVFVVHISGLFEDPDLT